MPCALAMVVLDAPDEALHDWGFACCEWKVAVDVEGTKTGEVGLDCLGLETLCTKGGDPLHNCALGGWENIAIGVPVCRVEGDEIEEVLLTHAVCALSAGCEAMPEIEGCLLRDERVCHILLRWGISWRGLCSRCGANWNRCKYWKQDAAPASVFKAEGSHSVEKEKFRHAASIRSMCRRDMV